MCSVTLAVAVVLIFLDGSECGVICFEVPLMPSLVLLGGFVYHLLVETIVAVGATPASWDVKPCADRNLTWNLWLGFDSESLSGLFFAVRISLAHV